ncbi:MAG: MmgE/PrpD family protein, partial [Nitriliruptorales bacterium]|nr:MmgE/PrpD family protein [Nitriliruptorales bacterium]
HGSSLASHAVVSVYGAAAAAAALEGLSPEQVRWVLSYATQQSSGVTTWLRDERHVEKAFVFGGMGARNGVAAATMVASGMDGVNDAFSGHPNALDALSPLADRSLLVEGLGERYEVMRTNIKKYAVGSPAQAAVQATEDLIERDGLTADQVERIQIHLPADLARIVDSRHMPDINCQYLVAGTLLDGRFTFEMAHDDARMAAPDVRDLIARTELLEDEPTRGTRKGRVVVHRRSGEPVEAFVDAVRGTAQNPMGECEITDKCRDLLHPLLGEQRGEELIDLLLNPDKVTDVRDLRSLLENPTKE